MTPVRPHQPSGVSLRRIELAATPEEMAVRLNHLPGFAWLDTAGNHQQEGEGISVLAACPGKILRGHLSDVSDLRHALEHRACTAAPDLGLPMGGLVGTVDYDGSFSFGMYDQMLIHRHATGEWWDVGGLLPFAAEEPSAPVSEKLEFHPSTSAEAFCDKVCRAKEYIASGDIYQVNLTHPFRATWPTSADPLGTYLKLRELSPAPYAAFLDQGDRQVLSSSPESFLKLSGNVIQTRPIKGTRPRYRELAADQKSMLDLLSSEKERAELLMITDLERNDLGQVCQFGSVTVPDLIRLERYAQVFHLVSTVRGTLRADVDHLAALQACFPGGSITGAPKKRAREVIAELEASPRGLYTGAVGFIGLNGESHFNIAIRTIVVEAGEAHFHVGAGIVADSEPLQEWEETLHKASGMLSAASVAGAFCPQP